MEIKLGADPEFFLKDKDGKWVSAHDQVPGTKKKPHKLSHGAVQADGTAVEININPAKTSKEFVDNLTGVLVEVRDMVDKKLDFSYTPSIIYPGEYFKALPKSAKEIGCEPDYNGSYGMFAPIENKTPARVDGQAMAGGHLHIGWTDKADIKDKCHIYDCTTVVQHLDQVLFIMSSLWDKDTERKRGYGRRCAYRPKPYGCEYRTLSNAWLQYPKLWPYIYGTSVGIMEFLEKGGQVKYDPDWNWMRTPEKQGKHWQITYGKQMPAWDAAYLQ